MLQGDITTALAALSGLIDRKARVYWGNCPAPERLPYVVIFQVGGSRVSTHGGGVNLAEVRLQIDCVASRLDDALSIRSSINDFLHATIQTVGNTKIQSATHQNDRDQFDGGPDFFVASTDFLLQVSTIT
jgi:hypothetical protein